MLFRLRFNFEMLKKEAAIVGIILTKNPGATFSSSKATIEVLILKVNILIVIKAQVCNP